MIQPAHPMIQFSHSTTEDFFTAAERRLPEKHTAIDLKEVRLPENEKPTLTDEDFKSLEQAFGAEGELLPLTPHNFRSRVIRYRLEVGFDIASVRPKIEGVLEKIIRAGGEISIEC